LEGYQIAENIEERWNLRYLHLIHPLPRDPFFPPFSPFGVKRIQLFLSYRSFTLSTRASIFTSISERRQMFESDGVLSAGSERVGSRIHEEVSQEPQDESHLCFHFFNLTFDLVRLWLSDLNIDFCRLTKGLTISYSCSGVMER
jgi:hypothetical protein